MDCHFRDLPDLEFRGTINDSFSSTCANTCIHSKNTRVRNWPGKGPLGPNSIPGQRSPGISQLDAECDPELGQSDPIICQVCRELTNFRVIFDPEWSLAPMDPFPGQADPGVFRVYHNSTSYKEISVPMTCLDCKSLLGNVVCKSMGNTRITEHNTRSIYRRPKLSLIVPRNYAWKSGKSRKWQSIRNYS